MRFSKVNVRIIYTYPIQCWTMTRFWARFKLILLKMDKTYFHTLVFSIYLVPQDHCNNWPKSRVVWKKKTIKQSTGKICSKMNGEYNCAIWVYIWFYLNLMQWSNIYYSCHQYICMQFHPKPFDSIGHASYFDKHIFSRHRIHQSQYAFGPKTRDAIHV